MDPIALRRLAALIAAAGFAYAAIWAALEEPLLVPGFAAGLAQQLNRLADLWRLK